MRFLDGLVVSMSYGTFSSGGPALLASFSVCVHILRDFEGIVRIHREVEAMKVK